MGWGGEGGVGGGGMGCRGVGVKAKEKGYHVYKSISEISNIPQCV